MNEELEKRLVTAFPHLFPGYRGDPAKSCMAFGMECGDGWFTILWGLCLSIDGYYKNLELNNQPAPVPVTFTQVKEKYGTLTVYYSGGDRSVRSIVSMAEAMSSLTCEACGSTTDVKASRSGWLYIRCQSCIDKDIPQFASAALQWEDCLKTDVDADAEGGIQ